MKYFKKALFFIFKNNLYILFAILLVYKRVINIYVI